MHAFLRKELEELPWYFSLVIIVAAIAGNVWEKGMHSAALNGGLAVGLLVSVGFLSLRRLVVGHWR